MKVRITKEELERLLYKLVEKDIIRGFWPLIMDNHYVLNAEPVKKCPYYNDDCPKCNPSHTPEAEKEARNKINELCRAVNTLSEINNKKK